MRRLRENILPSSCQRGARVSAQNCEVTSPISCHMSPGVLARTEQQSWWIHILFQRQFTITLLLTSVEMEKRLSQAEPWSSLIRPLELPSSRRVAFQDFTDRKQYARVSDLLGASQSSSTGCCGLTQCCTAQRSGASLLHLLIAMSHWNVNQF